MLAIFLLVEIIHGNASYLWPLLWCGYSTIIYFFKPKERIVFNLWYKFVRINCRNQKTWPLTVTSESIRQCWKENLLDHVKLVICIYLNIYISIYLCIYIYISIFYLYLSIVTSRRQSNAPMRPSSSPQWLCGDMPAMDGQRRSSRIVSVRTNRVLNEH